MFLICIHFDWCLNYTQIPPPLHCPQHVRILILFYSILILLAFIKHQHIFEKKKLNLKFILALKTFNIDCNYFLRKLSYRIMIIINITMKTISLFFNIHYIIIQQKIEQK